MSTVFFSRCKPQEVDVIDLVLNHRKLFIGYPMHTPGASYDPHNLGSCVVNPASPDDVWWPARELTDRRREYNQNRNLVRKVDADHIKVGLIPRPSRGLIYCGLIKTNFELINDPPWYDEYMSLRAHVGASTDGPETWHAADVAQCWAFEDIRPIPVPRIPAWIRRSLFGRSTYGIVHPDQDIGLDPFNELISIMATDSDATVEWTHNLEEVERRLLNNLTPSTFEHLVVSLLQLQNPDEIWSQVGGSGDGGLDGVGAGTNGTVSALLQCKWQYWGGNPFSDQVIWNFDPALVNRYLASLRYPKNVAIPEGIQFLDRPKIAALVVEHAARLPQALSMRIGNPSI